MGKPAFGNNKAKLAPEFWITALRGKVCGAPDDLDEVD